jgi:SAM-dependent MidA family methyltransferase
MPNPVRNSQMSEMREILKAEMQKTGAISFARFMELALYCPKFGYYEREGVSPGQSGDFYTSVSVGEVFGELLAFEFTEWLAAIPAPRQIVEAGAHDGRLACDILRWLHTEKPELAKTVEYWILEPSARRKESQVAMLQEFKEQVRWFASWEEAPASGVNGIIFANELLDAMPVHRLGWEATTKKWFEWGVGFAKEDFFWTRMELKIDIAPKGLPEELLAILPDGFTTEICPAATAWWQQAAMALWSGKIMTCDYGLSAEQFFTPERREGTLRAYHRHQQNGELLARVGEQDLTAQVNFTEIATAGESRGLKTEIWTSQGRFLTRVLEKMIAQKNPLEKWTPAKTRQFQTLTHPEHLGRSFQVIVQSR